MRIRAAQSDADGGDGGERREVVRLWRTRQAVDVPFAQEPSRHCFAGKREGPSSRDAEAPVVAIVDADEPKVEADLLGGLLLCPDCSETLGPWGYARWRSLRRGEDLMRFRPRRSMCGGRAGCGHTHVLLPDTALIRRRDHAEVIVSAIEAKAQGESRAAIAKRLGRHADTVRGWLQAFARGAEAIRAFFTRWAHALDPGSGPIEPAGSAFRDAVNAFGVAARAWVLRFGPRPVFAVVSALSLGALIHNTNVPYRGSVIA
jgi:hypothetical protein